MKGRVALVTGASRGIGAAIAARLEAGGARVLKPSRREMDLGSAASIQGWLEANPGRIDILVNNAGINRLGSAGEVSRSDFDETVAVNLAAPFALSAALGGRMKANGWGRIVNIASIWALVARERRVSYSAAKSGLVGLSRSLAVELAPHVLVNVVAPGYVDTDLTRANNSPAEIAMIERQIPLERMAKPEEIAEVVAFLGSSANGYVTGQVITADGGYTCR